jgi:hypothetical protein
MLSWIAQAIVMGSPRMAKGAAALTTCETAQALAMVRLCSIVTVPAVAMLPLTVLAYARVTGSSIVRVIVTVRSN